MVWNLPLPFPECLEVLIYLKSDTTLVGEVNITDSVNMVDMDPEDSLAPVAEHMTCTYIYTYAHTCIGIQDFKSDFP